MILEMLDWAYKQLLARLTQPAGGVGIIETLGSGYSTEEERMANVIRLRELCDEAVNNPAFAPRDGKTYCNFAARFIAEGMGYFGFPTNALANELIAVLASAPEWHEDSIARAHAHAMRGGLALLVLEEHPHGHVAAIYPVEMEPSGSWGEAVPLLANVGVKNGIWKASAVFRAHSPVRAFLFGETA